MTKRTKKRENMFHSCDGATYAIMLTHHELQTLLRILTKIKRRGRFAESIRKKVVRPIRLSAKDHQYHIRRGTCILLKKNREDEE